MCNVEKLYKLICTDESSGRTLVIPTHNCGTVEGFSKALYEHFKELHDFLPKGNMKIYVLNMDNDETVLCADYEMNGDGYNKYKIRLNKIEASMAIVAFFLSEMNDKGIYDFPQSSLNSLKSELKVLETMVENKEIPDEKKTRVDTAIANAKRFLSIASPMKLHKFE